MTIERAVKHIGRKVRLVSPRLYIDSWFTLSEIVVGERNNQLCYSARLIDPVTGQSTIQCRLSEILDSS